MYVLLSNIFFTFAKSTPTNNYSMQSDKEIFDGNRLIADFNGYLVNAAGSPYFYAMKHAYDYGNLQYHFSWDWLIPPLQKAEKIISDSEWDTAVEKQANADNNPNFSKMRDFSIGTSWKNR